MFGENVNLDKVYFNAIEKYYNDKELVEFIKQGEEMAIQMSKGEIVTEASTGGNLLVRYIDSEQGVFILGVVSKSGKMNKNDIKSYHKWVKELLILLKKGHPILSSPNKLSKPLLNKIITKAEKEGLNTKQETMGTFERNGMLWENIMLTLA